MFGVVWLSCICGRPQFAQKLLGASAAFITICMRRTTTGKELLVNDDILYLGVKGSVVARQKSAGAEPWRRHRKGSSFVRLAAYGWH